MRSKSSRFAKTRRPGFTLIEVVVVVAVVAILVGLVLSSVLQAREAARRSFCKNNLKQIGLAMFAYEQSHQQFPCAATFVVDPANRNITNAQSWGMALLPFLDQEVLANSFDPNQAPWSATGSNSALGGNAALIGTNLPVFRCPSTAVDFDQNDTEWSDATLGIASGVTKSLGGITSLATPITARWASSDYFVVTDVRSPLYSADLVTVHGPTWDRRHGMFYCDSNQASNVPVGVDAVADAYFLAHVNGNPRDASPTISKVTDGLSNTVMLGECAGRNQMWELGRNVTPDQDRSIVFSQHYCHQKHFGGGGWADPTNASWIDGGQPSGNNDITYSGTGSCVINCTNQLAKGFYSWHMGGAQFLMGDGSVRFFSRSMDNLTLAELVTRAGHEVTYGGF